MSLATKFSLVLSLTLSCLVFPTISNAQTIEQLQQLRNQASASNSTGTSATGNARISPLEVNSESNLSSASSQASSLSQYSTQTRNGLVLPGEPTVADVYPYQEKLENPPFAANLFIGGFESERTDGLNDNYAIAPGDKLNIWLWGAVNFADVVTVDNQGNIFIPNIGPLALANTPASSVNATVSNKIKQVYTNDVNIYVNLLTSTPVSVFVSGPVLRPGQYAGQAADSVLYFLKRAGGIDFQRGSFRAIDVIRNGQTVETIDLYKFSRSGVMPSLSFKDGDVILVHPIGDTVTVTSGARNSFTFELATSELDGNELTQYAHPGQFISHATVTGIRQGNQVAKYVSIDELANLKLHSGDQIEFINDHETQVYRINIAGSYNGPSQYMVPKGTRIHDVLAQVAVDQNLADYENVYLLRESVAAKQKQIIDSALQRLERSVYTAPVSSTGEGAIRVQEAQLVSDFVARARQVEPLGTVVISDAGKVANILLEPNDTIVIPERSDLIHVGGEVLMPQSIVFNQQAGLTDYIAWAGGFAERANAERILIIHPNGTIDFTSVDDDTDFNKSDGHALQAGDKLVVLPKVDAKTLQAVKDITQIVYQIAVAANVAVN